MQAQLHRGDDAEASAAAAQGPEEVARDRRRVAVTMLPSAVTDLGAQQAVGREAVAARRASPARRRGCSRSRPPRAIEPDSGARPKGAAAAQHVAPDRAGRRRARCARAGSTSTAAMSDVLTRIAPSAGTCVPCPVRLHGHAGSVVLARGDDRRRTSAAPRASTTIAGRGSIARVQRPARDVVAGLAGHVQLAGQRAPQASRDRGHDRGRHLCAPGLMARSSVLRRPGLSVPRRSGGPRRWRSWLVRAGLLGPLRRRAGGTRAARPGVRQCPCGWRSLAGIFSRSWLSCRAIARRGPGEPEWRLSGKRRPSAVMAATSICDADLGAAAEEAGAELGELEAQLRRAGGLRRRRRGDRLALLGAALGRRGGQRGGEAQRHVGASDGHRDGRGRVPRSAPWAASRARSCAGRSRTSPPARRWGRPCPRTVSWPAPQSTTSRWPSATVVTVSLALPAWSTSEPGPSVTAEAAWPGAWRRCVVAGAGCRCARAARARTESRGTSGSASGHTGSSVSALSATAMKSPVLLVDSVTSSALPVTSVRTSPPASTLGCRLAPAEGARAAASSAPAHSATVAAARPSLIMRRSVPAAARGGHGR